MLRRHRGISASHRRPHEACSAGVCRDRALGVERARGAGRHPPGVPGEHRPAVLKKATNPKVSRLTWRFARGPLTTEQDLGDPFTTDSYAVCLYDGSANTQPLYAAAVPAGGACGSVACWRELGFGGVDYYDPKLQFVDGITQIRVTPGNPGRSRALVRGRGTRLALPDTPLTTPVTLQLQGSHGECWSGTFATQIAKNADGAFKAKPDL